MLYFKRRNKLGGGRKMSRQLQAKYSKHIKSKQLIKSSVIMVERVAKLPSGKIASRALRERGRQSNEQQQ